MRCVLCAAVMLVLSGCATYSDLKQRPADFSATTVKDPKEYLECVVPLWLGRYAGAHIIADGDVEVLVAPVGGGTPDIVAATLTAVVANGSTQVEMKHLSSLSDFQNQWHQAQSCL